MNPSITPVGDTRCELAENPLWDERKQCLYWTDIPAGKLHRYDPATGAHQIIYQGPPAGGFTIEENGELLLFRVDDIALLKADGTVQALKQWQDEGMARFNDVIADPRGRVFAGTIGKSAESGGLYRVDLDGAITKLLSGTGCSNGMGFSPDVKTFYWTCSTTRRIFSFDYDSASGALANRRLFHEVQASDGIPDGLAVDAEGCVWSARWGGFSVKRHAPDGKVLSSLSVPVRNVTSLCFGAGALNTLFITTAKAPGESSALAGAVLTLAAPVRGNAEFRSALSRRCS